MGDKTGIEWTDATWNPTIGCSIVSPGCTNCYAMKMAARIEHMGGKGGAKYAGLTQLSKAGPVWTGSVRLNEDALGQPLRWRRPRRIFVNSMSDLFHEALEPWEIAQVFATMACAQQHEFQVLTKRHDRMHELLTSEAFWDEVDCFTTEIAFDNSDAHARRSDDYRAVAAIGTVDIPLPNVWLGVSVEDQQRADERIPHLLATPAAVRFLSCEPLLGPVNLRRLRVAPNHHTIVDALDGYALTAGGRTQIDWVIAGGESGPGARPMSPAWAKSLRDQCMAAGVAFFHKQNGEYREHGQFEAGDSDVVTDGVHMVRVGKERAGRLLDGREHNEFPR
jgi:protein gp37